MAIHVAILQKPYPGLILGGVKTVESRLTRTRQPPFRCVEPGERLFIKQSSGPFVATAVAGRVECFHGLTPEAVDQLRARFNDRVRGEDAYWQRKRDAAYATFVELTEVEPLDVGPRYKPANMKAWYVLDDHLSPLRDWTITEGALKNSYASLGPGSLSSPASARLKLVLDDQTVTTDIARGRMLRWRGWRSFYRVHDARPGDAIRFVCVAPRTYRVSFRRTRDTVST